MRFLIDRCAGRILADWLRKQGHDVVVSRELGPDPGDRALLEWAANEARILITIDTDFGQLVYVDNVAHAGLSVCRMFQAALARRYLKIY